MQSLTLETLKRSVALFLHSINHIPIVPLFGVTDGKAVGTFVEHAFHDYLKQYYTYGAGSAAKGIDFPEQVVDLKVTSVRQPQSSCPFSSASQKVYGLGYHLLIFVYDKVDDDNQKVAYLKIQNAIFLQKEFTADYQTTKGLLDILMRQGNRDDIDAFLEERNLPLDEIGRAELADRILQNPPQQGYLTISNALQWRLQYGRVITLATEKQTLGIEDLLS